MNFGDLAQCVEDQNDLEKLVRLCNSYGLNEQETDQIINDFRNGLLCGNDQSLEESFQQSLREMDVQEGQISRREEYSFKHQKYEMESFKHKMSVENNDSLDENSQIDKRHSRSYNQENSFTRNQLHIYEAFMKERRQFQKNIYSKLEEQNKRLLEELDEKNAKIDLFMKMKVQDSEIILGLKDTITNLTKINQQKQQNYQDLQEKYEKVQKQQQEYLQSKDSKATFFHHQSLAESESRKSVNQKDRRRSINTAILRESQNNEYTKKIQKKESKKYLRDSSAKNIKTVDVKENKENYKEQKVKRPNRIDIGKYKGMIEELRNSYCQFR